MFQNAGKFIPLQYPKGDQILSQIIFKNEITKLLLHLKINKKESTVVVKTSILIYFPLIILFYY